VITGFDHVVIAVRDIAAGAAAYETLLGARADVRTQDSVATARIATRNLLVELMAPAGESDAAARVRAVLEDGEGLKSLVFAVRDIEALHRRADRVNLAPEPIAPGEGYLRFRLPKERAYGARLFFLEREALIERAGEGGVLGIDHIVIRTPEPDRAAALYGARLALDMRLDRELLDRRLMFFRCGDAVLEVVHVSSLAKDDLWGLSWRVVDADAARARLAAAGLDVSDVRQGMKPGTRVFSVRNGTCGVPTLMMETAERGA
jgi:catechol 2,3-dioxygenase-like lactoylglutathione lyase family enzyme